MSKQLFKTSIAMRAAATAMLVALALLMPADVCCAQRGGVADTFSQQLAVARSDYYKSLNGDHDADARARQEFDLLARQQPSDAVVMAYQGSLQLLEAARTWAVWNKRKLADDGLAELDRAVAQDPGNLEARFVRAASVWHLPFIYKRRQQAEEDFLRIGPLAEGAARDGRLPPEIAASALDYYGQVLLDRKEHQAAEQAFVAAVRVGPASPAGKDAARRLHTGG